MRLLLIILTLWAASSKAAIQFDGVDDFVSFSHPTEIDGSQLFNVLFWCKPDNAIQQNAVAVGMLSASFTNGFAVQWISNQVHVYVTGFIFGLGNYQAGVETTNYGFTTNTWHH